MRRKNGFLLLLVWLVVIIVSIIFTGYDSEANGSWAVKPNITPEGDRVLEIAYGSGTNFPQYAVLHLKDSYFRLNYGPGSGWGTSVILLPSFWEDGACFKLTDSSFQKLKNEGVPDTVLNSLKVLENQEFTTENELLVAVENQIGKEQTVKYKDLILKHAEKGVLHQGAEVTAEPKFDGEDLVFSIEGMISTLSVQIQLRISPPVQGSILADVTVNVDGDVELEPKHIEDNEGFKPVMLSSMHISPDEWDTQAAFVGSQTFPIPGDGWIIYPAVSGNRFGLQGGTSDWKINAPTVEILLDENRPITGWVKSVTDPNKDNVGFWAASDQIVRSYHYTINASNPVRTISFSGYEWIVKTSHGDQVGPGPNYFSDSEENVWVDGEGKLHLKITQQDGKWYCAEVISKENFGYGTYRFYTESRIDQLDKNVVLGLFTWDDDPAYSHREIDIEFSKWSNPVNDNAQFVVQPYTTSSNMHRFNVDLNGTHSTHSFDWKPNEIFFQSAHGHYADPPDTHIIDSWSYTGPDIPLPGNENARMNLWLFQGDPPSDSQEVEVIISAFEFVPIGTPPPPPPPPPPAIPEPATFLLLGMGLIGVLILERRRLNRKK